MSRRLTVRLSDELADGIEIRARHSEKTRQTDIVDAAQLIREVRGGALRLRLRRLTVPFMQADLA